MTDRILAVKFSTLIDKTPLGLFAHGVFHKHSQKDLVIMFKVR